LIYRSDERCLFESFASLFQKAGENYQQARREVTDKSKFKPHQTTIEGSLNPSIVEIY
jgi:hypothetical protein